MTSNSLIQPLWRSLQGPKRRVLYVTLYELIAIAAATLGLALLVPVLMAITFAPALIFFHGVGAWQAARLSFKGCMCNMWPFLWWGLLGAVLIFFGAKQIPEFAKGLGKLFPGTDFIDKIESIIACISRLLELSDRIQIEIFVDVVDIKAEFLTVVTNIASKVVA